LLFVDMLIFPFVFVFVFASLESMRTRPAIGTVAHIQFCYDKCYTVVTCLSIRSGCITRAYEYGPAK
jgi:hypothetical protein